MMNITIELGSQLGVGSAKFVPETAGPSWLFLTLRV